MSSQVEPAALSALLRLQAEDTAIQRLELRRESLPETRRLEELTAQLEELEADLDIARKQVAEIEREQSRLEGQMELADGKIAREQQRLFSGSVSNPKELGALQAEVSMLNKQRGTLEDTLLEVMVQRDQATETRDLLEDERTTLTATSEELTTTVQGLWAEIDTELAAHRTARDAIVVDIPTEVVELYESLRDSKGGVGAAALVGGMCDGCHTQLPAREVERLRAQGGLQRCDNCRRILVIA